jgi:hypothetical protein
MADEAVSVTFGSVRDLSALHRMLMNRKFEGPDDVFFASPQIAAAQHAIVNTLISAEPHRAQAWKSWRDASAHPLEVQRVRDYLHNHTELVTGMNQTQRRDFVATLLAPLIADPDLLTELAESDRSTTDLDAQTGDAPDPHHRKCQQP